MVESEKVARVKATLDYSPAGTPIQVDFLRTFIRGTLQMAGLWSMPAEELLLGTAAQESHLGKYRRQIGGGPGTGIYQIELLTERSLWNDWIALRPSIAVIIMNISGVSKPDPLQLEFNLAYQTLMARLRYFAWVKAPIPESLVGQAIYWDTHYNCNPNYGTPEEYISNYRKYVTQ